MYCSGTVSFVLCNKWFVFMNVCYLQKKWIKILNKEYPTMAFHANIKNSFGKGSLIDFLRHLKQVSFSLWTMTSFIYHTSSLTCHLFTQYNRRMSMCHSWRQHSNCGCSSDGAMHFMCTVFCIDSMVYWTEPSTFPRMGGIGASWFWWKTHFKIPFCYLRIGEHSVYSVIWSSVPGYIVICRAGQMSWDLCSG